MTRGLGPRLAALAIALLVAAAARAQGEDPREEPSDKKGWERWMDVLGSSRLLATEISQLVLGAKLRLVGDVVYTPWPAVALGVQYKRNLDFELPRAVGAEDRDGVDVYLAATKLFLEGALGHPVLLSAALRATRANELGLLGFGGNHSDDYQPMFEGSAVVLLTRHLALGAEFRQKPDNLRGLDEDPWVDVFGAVFANKHLALVGGYAYLGDVALWKNQDSYYLSAQVGSPPSSSRPI